MRAKEKANYLVQRFSKLEKGLDEMMWLEREVIKRSHRYGLHTIL